MSTIARKSISPPAVSAALLELRGASKHFVKPLDLATRIASLLGAGTKQEVVRAVDDVDFAILPGETVGLVGEPGSGKSTLGRLATGLLPLSAGERYWRGEPLSRLRGEKARRQQLKTQMVFPDPHTSLNQRMRVVDIVGEAPVANGIVSAKAKIEYVGLLLNRVGVDPTQMRHFPHEFPDAQQARIGIARALSVKPEFLVIDEPLAAVDLAARARMLKLLVDLKAALNLTFLFISRDIGAVEHISDRVAIMHLGRVVESGPTAKVLAAPNHPYTQALVADAGKIARETQALVPIKGDTTSPLVPPPGCRFHPRCPYAMPKCRSIVPGLREIAPGRLSACHLNDA